MILQEQAAVDYLGQILEAYAANSLPHQSGRYIHAAVSLQHHLLNRYLDQGRIEEATTIEITPSGFPSVLSMHQDTLRLLNEYAQIKADRIKSVRPDIELIATGQFDRLLATAASTSQKLDTDNDLVTLVNGFTERNYLRWLSKPVADPQYPLRQFTEFSGLTMEGDATRFRVRGRFGLKQDRYYWQPEYGHKYIDDPKLENRIIITFRMNNNYDPETGTGIAGSLSYLITADSCSLEPEIKQGISTLDQADLKIKRILANNDSTKLTAAEFSHQTHVLGDFIKELNLLDGIYEKIMKGHAITPGGYAEQVNQHVVSIKVQLELMPVDQREAAQELLAETLNQHLNSADNNLNKS